MSRGDPNPVGLIASDPLNADREAGLQTGQNAVLHGLFAKLDEACPMQDLPEDEPASAAAPGTVGGD